VPDRPRVDGGGSGGGGSDCDPNDVVTGPPCLKGGVGNYDCYGGSGNGPNSTPGHGHVTQENVSAVSIMPTVCSPDDWRGFFRLTVAKGFQSI
jgi:hypothetical protein